MIDVMSLLDKLLCLCYDFICIIFQHRYSCENSPLSKNELISHMIESEDSTLEDIEACMAVFKRKEVSHRLAFQFMMVFFFFLKL